MIGGLVLLSEPGLSYDQKQRLTDSLLAINGVPEPESRNTYVRELESMLRERLSFNRQADPRLDVWELVGACATHTGALHCLAYILRYFNGRSEPANVFLRLVDEVEPNWLIERLERAPIKK